MIAQACDNARVLQSSARFELADGVSLPFPDGYFEVVVNRLVLTQILDPEHALAEWTRVLRPGGRLIVIDGDATKVRPKLWHKAWKVVSVPFVYFSEGRNPLKNRMPMHVWNQLPLVRVERPAWEADRFRKLGLEGVRVEVVPRRSLGMMEFIKHGCWATIGR